jgi:hypothetical protein
VSPDVRERFIENLGIGAGLSTSEVLALSPALEIVDPPVNLVSPVAQSVLRTSIRTSD